MKKKTTTSKTDKAKAPKKVREMSASELKQYVSKLSENPDYAFLKKQKKSSVKKDASRESKPKGWRFKGDSYKKPSKKKIKEGGDDIYYEARPLHSDVSKDVKLAKGGGVGYKYVVNVGNIGNISCKTKAEAEKTYNEYVMQSESGKGRAGGEYVGLMIDGEPVKEHFGSNMDGDDEYAKGGAMSSFLSKAKKLGSKGFAKAKELGGKGVEKAKELAHEQKRKMALNVISQTKSKVGKEDKSALGKASSIVKKKFGLGGKVTNIDNEIATDSLKKEVKSKMKKGDDVIHFAFTDYGGDFLDKVAIEYFKKKYPKNIVSEDTAYSGENAFVFGKPATEWIKSSEDYPLGFENFEDYYYEQMNQEEYDGFELFLRDLDNEEYDFDFDAVLDWLIENKGGNYSVTTQGLDFSYSDLVSELEEEGLITKEEYAKGGSVHKRSIKMDNRYKARAKGVRKSRKYSTITMKDGSTFRRRNANQFYPDGVEGGIRYTENRLDHSDKFARGGSLDDTPKVYVADLEAYNGGSLQGDWLDLSEFDSGSEVMDKIQEMLESWSTPDNTKEEYAIHDYEGFPESMYSESMGESDFDDIITAYKVSQDRSIPMSVVGSIMSDYSPRDLESWIDDNYEGEFSSDEELAESVIDSMLKNLATRHSLAILTMSDMAETLLTITPNTMVTIFAITKIKQR